MHRMTVLRNGKWVTVLPLATLLFVAASDGSPPPPTKGISIVSNVRSAAADAPVPEPFFAVRAAGAISGPGDALVIPPAVPELDYEGELAIVIGRRASRVSPEDAQQYIRGYTCGMDGTAVYRTADGALDWGRSLAGKSVDGIAPVGGGMVDALDPQGHDVVLRINGEEKERFRTTDLVWDPHRIVSEVSQTVTLEPGDVIYTGTRRPIPRMAPGDVVEVEISGICTLRNPVVGASPTSAAD